MNAAHVALFLSFSGHGGVERMVANLAGGLAGRGLRVDLVLARAQGGHAGAWPDGVRVVPLGTRHTHSALPALVTYLRRERPAAVLAAKDRAIRVAVVARRLSGVPVRLVGRLGTTVTASLAGRSAATRLVWYLGMRGFYPQLDALVAVSEGVAADVRAITGLPQGRVTVVRNPVVTHDLDRLASAPVEHPWLDTREPPVVVGMGRLTRQKDFPTLLQAFARVRAVRPCRLMILGEGRQREELTSLAHSLGLEGDVSLPGFVANPYPVLAAATVFVLSSAWEGSPNALTEAMALGTPVVATDCPSGPAELLRGGAVAPLVAVGDDAAMAEAILRQLERPTPAQDLREAVRDYHVDVSARAYAEVLGLS
ncbi:MAG: glycosyltransferase [Gammaproteobacteria bacterium]|jgi:glycosyltransferase involved in cell wall biosynthesis|nr:glycosyltransferase [Gammaproteobacteria bacterium]